MRKSVSLWLTGEGVLLSPRQRAIHTYVIGQPGTGKSRALESWVMQDILAGFGVGVIDPAGDLYQNLLFRISHLASRQPDLAERVVLIDPSDPVWTVGFNPLEPIRNVSRERLAWFLTDVIIKIWKVDETTAPRMLRLLTFTFLVLSEFELSLVDLPRFLCDQEWREGWIERTSYYEAAQYFQFEFPKTEAAVHQWVTPVLNKIGPLIFDPDVRLMLSAGSTINFRQILDQNLILLVNLSKGILGEGNSSLLGAFVMAHIQQAALARVSSRRRDPFFLYLDEFQNYTTDNIQDILAESRKYGLSLVLAHQYLSQLSDDLRGAVLNTTGTIACFRVGYDDASVLAKEIFPPSFLKRSHQWTRRSGVAHWLGAFLVEEGEPTNQEAVASLLTQLNVREFWTKQRGPSLPIKQRTMNMPAPLPTTENWRIRKELLDTVGQRYGKLRKEVRQQRNYRQPDHGTKSTTYYEKT